MYRQIELLENPDRVAKEIERMTSMSSLGTLQQPIARSLFGISHRNRPAALPMNKDQHGIALFTRPRLNLSDDNIRLDRRLAWLKTDKLTSVNNYIRCLLDPDLQITTNLTCPLVDPFQAFIPIMTNTLESLTNWRDISPATYQYAEGLYKESQSFYDGPSLDYSLYDIAAGFRNTRGNILTKALAVWCHYGFFVFEGRLAPYPDYWWNFEIDYNTRIFKLSLDETKSYVTQLTSTIAYPLNAPTGATANFEANAPFNESNAQLSVSFRAHGTETLDNILFEEFNAIVQERNPMMRDQYRLDTMHQLTKQELTFFDNFGYPHIDIGTKKITWWIFKSHYQAFFPD